MHLDTYMKGYKESYDLQTLKLLRQHQNQKQ